MYTYVAQIIACGLYVDGGSVENVQHLYLYGKVIYEGLFIWKYEGG